MRSYHLVITSVLLFCLTLVVYFPGMMNIDAYYQLSQVRRNWFNDWHPPFMALIWRPLDLLVAGPFLMLVAQVALLVTGLAMVSNQLPVRTAFKSLFLILVFLFPPTFGMAGNIIKDIWMAGWLLLALGILLRYESSRLAAVAGITALGLAILFRYNGIVPATLIAIGFLHQHLFTGAAPGRRWIWATLMALPLMLGLGLGCKIINRAITDINMPYTQQILLFDLVGITIRTGDMDLIQKAIRPGTEIYRRDDVSLDLLRSKYFPSTWTPLVFEADSPYQLGTDEDSRNRLSEGWRQAILAHPLDYVEHRWAVFRQLIGLHANPLFAPVYFGIPPDSPDLGSLKKFNLHDYNSELSRVQCHVRDVLLKFSNSTFYRPYIWLSIATLLLPISWVWYQQAPWVTLILLSSIANEVILFLVAPSADYRYSHWTILTTWAALWAMALIKFVPLPTSSNSPPA